MPKIDFNTTFLSLAFLGSQDVVMRNRYKNVFHMGISFVAWYGSDKGIKLIKCIVIARIFHVG